MNDSPIPKVSRAASAAFRSAENRGVANMQHGWTRDTSFLVITLLSSQHGDTSQIGGKEKPYRRC